MKKAVLGWDWYDDDRFMPVPGGVITEEMWDAVLQDVIEHGYLFTGEDQQEEPYCCPVLDDYRIARFSRRGFAHLMAEAHGETGEYDYARYMEGFSIKEKYKVFPDKDSHIAGRAPTTFWDIPLDKESFETAIKTLYETDFVEEGKHFFLTNDQFKKYLVVPMPFDEDAPRYWKFDRVTFCEEGTDRSAFYSMIERIWAFDSAEEYNERMNLIGEEADDFVFVGKNLETVQKSGKFLLLFIQ